MGKLSIGLCLALILVFVTPWAQAEQWCQIKDGVKEAGQIVNDKTQKKKVAQLKPGSFFPCPILPEKSGKKNFYPITRSFNNEGNIISRKSFVKSSRGYVNGQTTDKTIKKLKRAPLLYWNNPDKRKHIFFTKPGVNPNDCKPNCQGAFRFKPDAQSTFKLEDAHLVTLEKSELEYKARMTFETESGIMQRSIWVKASDLTSEKPKPKKTTQKINASKETEAGTKSECTTCNPKPIQKLKEVAEEIVEKLTREKFIYGDLQKKILGLVGNNRPKVACNNKGSEKRLPKEDNFKKHVLTPWQSKIDAGKTYGTYNMEIKKDKDYLWKKNTITAEKLLALESLARTIYGELQNCFTNNEAYGKAAARIIYNRAQDAIDKGRPFVCNTPDSQKGKSLEAVVPYVAGCEEFNVWKNSDVNLDDVLCPDINSQPWRDSVAVAMETILQPDRFDRYTRSLQTFYFYTSNVKRNNKNLPEADFENHFVVYDHNNNPTVLSNKKCLRFQKSEGNQKFDL